MRRVVPLLLAGILIVVGFGELDQYGVNWDEALGDLFFGDRYASFFSTFDSRYLDFASEPYPPGRVPDLSISPYRGRPHEHWPVASTLGAFTSRAFQALGLLDPFDGFHAVNLFLAAILLIVFYRFVERCVSTPAAIVSTLLLFLMPRVVADLMANPKDFPQMVFFSLSLIAFYTAYEKGSAWGVAALGLVWGLALGTKANALFLPFIAIAFMLIRGLPDAWRDRRRTLLFALAAAGVLGFAVLFASWPWLWEAPIARLRENFEYIYHRGSGVSPTEAPWWKMVLFTTPPLVLVLLAASVPGVVRRAQQREPHTILLLSWIGIVVARLSIPGATNFDVVRHFLEIFPPLAALAGIAAVEWTQRLTASRSLRAAVLSVPIASVAWATIATHPFETVYWNAFIGGYSGAREREIPQAGDYWGVSYRHGLGWMNRYAPPNSVLVVTIAGHTVRMVAPVRLRPDIRVVEPPRVSVADALRWPERYGAIAAKRPVYVMFVLREEWRTPLDVDAETRLVPEAAWVRDGAPVLLLYRYRP